MAMTAGGRSTKPDLGACSLVEGRLPLLLWPCPRFGRSSSSPRPGRAGSISSRVIPALEAHEETSTPVERCSCLLACGMLGAGNGTGVRGVSDVTDMSASLIVTDCGDEAGGEASVARTTLR